MSNETLNMNAYPKFSVIVPNYNNAGTLKRAIDSILEQSYKNFEVIVIDDGSTDQSREILETYREHVVLILQKNQGVSKARNNGAKIANGDWLTFLDADDVFHPDRLRHHAEWIQDEPTLDFLLAEQESRNPNGGFLGYFMRGSELGDWLLSLHKEKERISIPYEMFGKLISNDICEIRTLSVPKNKFLGLGGFPEEHSIGEDLHFFIRLIVESQRAGIVPHALATYYIYGESVLRKDPLRTMRQFDTTLSSLEEYIKDAPRHIEEGFLLKRRNVKLSLAYALLRAGRKRAAILAVAPLLIRQPGAQSLRDVLSVARGIR